MSILNSMYSGVSGLQANGRGMSAISDNISNANTVGFKRSRVNFQDMMSMTIMGVGNFSQVGMGTAMMNVQQMFGQGSFSNSTNATDMAINGGGFFIVNGNVKGVSGDFYSRAGQFHFNKDGFLVNQQNLRVQGYGVEADDPDGTIMGGLGDIRITDTQIPPRATENIEMNANLNSEADTAVGPFDGTSFDTAMSTSNYHTVTTVYDSLGNSHDLTVYFTKTGTAPNEWEYNVVADDGDLGGVAGEPNVLTTGNIEFDNDGNLVNLDGNLFNVTFEGAAAQDITIDLGTPGSTDIDEVGLTQYSSSSTVHFTSQDGYATGNLSYINVNEDGLITGAYSNGEMLNLGKVALANFTADQGLDKMGGNLWKETSKSGEALVGEANTGTRGTIKGNSLEESNVDIAEEFVDMIITQKAYDANAKSIQSTDQMLDTILTLKR